MWVPISHSFPQKGAAAGRRVPLRCGQSHSFILQLVLDPVWEAEPAKSARGAYYSSSSGWRSHIAARGPILLMEKLALGQRTTGDMDKRKIWVTKWTQCLETREVCLELGEILQWQPEPPLSKLIGWSKLIITGWLRKSQERQKNTIPFPFRWKLQYKPFYC